VSIFLLVVVFAIVFVLSTSQFMPDIVGSHFGLAGHADSLMPRGFYIRFMLSLLLGLPLLLVVIPNLFLSSSTARINLPNRDYWLAPEQRADTIAFLRNHNLRLGSILILFFCYVHWLVVQANRVHPPHLSSFWFVGGLVMFIVANLIWTVALFRRFRRPS
jgi:serine/threonine-protein kinase